MTIAYILAQDSVNPDAIPANVLAAGYDTGSGIAWGTAGFAAHTKPYPAIHIDQDPNASDPLADILDVEAQAATVPEIVGWVTRARAAFKANTRPGQRWPAIYLSTGNLSQSVSDLQSAGLTDVPFWVAKPGIGEPVAISEVQTATGPYPAIGIQYQFGNSVDLDVFSLPWVTTVSGITVPKTISQGGWNWCHKCQGLFFGPNMSHSICPAGGTHDNANSGDYTLSDLP